MKAGDLDRRVTIQRPGTVDDPEYGPQPGGWEDVAARVPAQKRDELPSRSESVEGGLAMAGRPARLRIRYMAGLSSDMRIVLHNGDDPAQDEFFQITGGPAEIGRREWIEFTIKAFST